jgi:Uma2 family endonuclease
MTTAIPQQLPPQAPELELPPEPDISQLVTEDETPVDNFLQEKLQRLLVHCLYDAFFPGKPFIAAADVGIFYQINKPAIAPDVMLSLGVSVPEDLSQKRNRSYFLWVFGKPPEMVLEIVSNRKGKELKQKKQNYAQMGVAYYVVYDPEQRLSEQQLQVFGLQEGRYHLLDNPWLPELGLGLTLWSGEFEGMYSDLWLRWCNEQGELLLLGSEQAIIEQRRAEEVTQQLTAEQRRAQKAEAKAARLAELLRSRGIDFDEEE